MDFRTIDVYFREIEKWMEVYAYINRLSKAEIIQDFQNSSTKDLLKIRQ